MANSLPSRLPLPCGALLALGLLGEASAQVPRCNEKIVVDARPVSVNYRDNTALLRDVVITQCGMRIEASEAQVVGGLDFESGQWTISGNVRIKAEGGSLRSDKAVVSFRDNLISKATITGAPAEFEQLRKDGTTSRGRANTIDYETSSGTVSLRENAWLSDGCNEITGQQLVYNIKKQSVGNAGPVRIVIQPGSGSGNPCTPQAPETKP